MHLPRPDRILMTADTLGGVWIYALDLARSLGTIGVEVHLATLGRPLTKAQAEQAAQIANLTIHESSFRLEWMEQPWDDLEPAGKWLLELEEKTRPDLIHLNHFGHGILPWKSPVLLVAHSCVFTWWNSVKRSWPPSPSDWDRYYRLVRGALRSADLVVTPSQYLLAEMRRVYGYFQNGLVIPNSRHYPTDIHPAPFEEREPCVFTAGRIWDEAKNLKALDQIAPDLPWPIYCAGNPRHPDGGTTQISYLQFLGDLDPNELLKKLSHAAIYALPAKYEPFGLSVLEAAHSSCAMVLGNTSSLRENWEDAAIFVNPNNPGDLAEAIRSLIDDPELRRSYSQKARDRAQAFHPDRTRDQYLIQYATLLRNEGPAYAEMRAA